MGKMGKLALPANIFYLSYFAKAAFFMEDIGPGHNALLPINLWVFQIPLGVLFLSGTSRCSATPREPRSSSRQRGRCRCRNAGPDHLGRGRLGSTRDSGTTSVDARSVMHAWCSCVLL